LDRPDLSVRRSPDPGIRRKRAALAAGIAAAALAASPPPGRPNLDTVLDALNRVRHFRDCAISGDGRRIAWSEKVRDPRGEETLGAVYLRDLPQGPVRHVTALSAGGARREQNPEFSPDGAALAFLSDAEEKGQKQIWLTTAAGGSPHRLTHVSGQVADPRWSPDGKRIAFLFVEGSSQEPGALVAYKPDAGVVAEKAEEQRIAVADAATGSVRIVSPADLYVYDYDWSPDGKSFAAEAAKGSGTDNYWTAELYAIDAASGAARSLWKPPLQIASPRFSPDGKWIAVIHGIMSDEGSNGGDVWLVPSAGGEARNATPGMSASASELFWRSKDLVFTEHVDGEHGLASLNPASGALATLWKAPGAIRGFAVARDGTASAIVRDSFREPPEVWAGAIGAWTQQTRANAGAPRYWGDARSLHWQSGGRRVQGWLLPPPQFDPAAKYPLAVLVHGGPSAAATADWPSRWTAALPSQGYFVLLPNPRGSYGFGEDFTRANVKDFGHGDFADILAGVDEALRAAPIDPKRLGVLGWSYGGYMTMWAVTQTDRFAAAVAGAGIVSWQSYYGQNRIDQWMLPFFGATVYDDPAVYAKSSPIEFIRKVKTPTLVLHGDRDSEVPTPQGYEFWHALKTLGVPTRLVIYENEGHGISRPQHQRDIQKRTVAWFDEYLGGRPRATAAGGR